MKRENRKAIQSGSRLKRRKEKESKYSIWKTLKQGTDIFSYICFLGFILKWVLKSSVVAIEHLYIWIPFILEILKTLISALSYSYKKGFFCGLYSD